jgi:hypothetical protein
MTYDISQAPLEFDNATQYESRATKVKAVLVLFGACLAFTAVMVVGRDPQAPLWEALAFSSIPYFVVGGGIFYMFVRDPPYGGAIGTTARSTLRIDSDGVHLRFGDRAREHPWADIRWVRIIKVRLPVAGVRVRVVQIGHRGQPLSNDVSNLIDSSFGLTVDELCALIQQGIEKWGGHGATPSPEAPRIVNL